MNRTDIPVTVRHLARPADAPVFNPGPLPPLRTMIRAWVTDAHYRLLHEKIGADCLWWMERAREPHDGMHAVTVLVEDENLVGLLEVGHGHLRYLGLLPRYRGRGLGKYLLAEAILQGAKTLTTSSADSPSALPLYLSAGFRVTRTEEQVWPVPDRLLPAGYARA